MAHSVFDGEISFYINGLGDFLAKISRIPANPPKGSPADAFGELWAIYFDGEAKRITAVKEVLPVNQCSFPDGDVTLMHKKLSAPPT